MVELEIKVFCFVFFIKSWLFYVHNNSIYYCFHITYMKFISVWTCKVIDFIPVSLLSSVRMSWYIFTIWSQWVRTFFRRLSQCGESSPSSFSSWFLLQWKRRENIYFDLKPTDTKCLSRAAKRTDSPSLSGKLCAY